jgi:hypothetical protein
MQEFTLLRPHAIDQAAPAPGNRKFGT